MSRVPAPTLDEPLCRKDRRDLSVAWPLLGEKRQRWLADSLARLYPDHPWREAHRVGEPVGWPSRDAAGRQDI